MREIRPGQDSFRTNRELSAVRLVWADFAGAGLDGIGAGELRCQLFKGDTPLSERWFYSWTP
ncbi:hypothetical protein OPIT5_00720 [Opitutaceae bacterium TAV5]|nr:hypothetical protein OPIT5_00720 [Opitutaceae bacterium TAV5]